MRREALPGMSDRGRFFLLLFLNTLWGAVLWWVIIWFLRGLYKAHS